MNDEMTVRYGAPGECTADDDTPAKRMAQAREFTERQVAALTKRTARKEAENRKRFEDPAPANKPSTVTLDPDGLAALRRDLMATVVALDELEARARRQRAVPAGAVQALSDRLVRQGGACHRGALALDFAVASA